MPDIGVTVAGGLLVLSLVLFLVFFDRFVHRLRPVAVAALVGRVARGVLATLTPQVRDATSAETAAGKLGLVTSVRDGSIQALDVPGLVRWAGRHRQLRGMVALGVERTVEQDPAFALRIMVDVAVKALSAAINDPTTAVQALDHIANVLGVLGSTPLHASLTFSDSRGTPRLVMPARTWNDYLTLGVTEIREYGATSIQVVRRLRALLEDLRASVRPEHRAAVDAEITKLNATVASGFAGSVDQAAARVRDAQGIGGPAHDVRVEV